MHKQHKQFSTVGHHDELQEESALTDTIIPLKNDEDDTVHIQFLEGMLSYKNISTFGTEMAIGMATAQGASLATAHITDQAQLLSEKINRNNQTLQTSMQSFQTKAQTGQQKNLQRMVTAFSNEQRDIQARTADAGVVSKLELDYLYKNISIDKPQQNYIFNQIQFDQLFTLGTMLTPAGQVWKNPFSVGDWQFDKTTNSFWQYQSSPIFNSSTDENQKTTLSSLQAENNSIFTEYYTNESEYTIAGNIKIYRADYPAFIGIIFNKSRWISGDFGAIRKSRLFGIYATSATDIKLYFTEQYTLNDAQIKADPTADAIQTPLQQIINKRTDKKIELPASLFASIQDKPASFDFVIKNKQQKATCTLSIENQEPISLIVENLDPALFMYHGVGFISPGAVTEYTLNQPTALVFDDQALLNFKD